MNVLEHHAPIIAPIMPAAYWISLGFNEPTAHGMEMFQCQLVDRKFIYAHVIYLEPATPNVEFVPHHDMLIQHWQVYLKSLVERGRTKSFFIEKFQLHQSIDVIVPSLMQMNQLGELGLCQCSIDRNGLLLVSNFLSKNHTLKRLLLNENQIEDVEVAGALSLAVQNHPKLEELCISHCGVGNNEHVLAEILGGCNRLKILRLNENNIGSESITYIGAFLARNPRLTCLRLDKNLLMDADAKHIVAALTTNSNLQYLYLKENHFTNDGKMETMTAVLDTTSLHSIADSNHECEIVYNTPVVASRINEKFWPTKRKVQSKVLLALYGMDNETPVIQYFNHVPLELIPHGLALIQKEMDCLEQHFANSFRMNNESRQLLTRMYRFLRVWNLPWLFDNGSHEAVKKRHKTSHPC